MQPTIRNHYLPKFYLKSFMNYDLNAFYVYYKGKNKPILQTPINTGVEKNLYNIKKNDGTIDDSIERIVLSPLEGAVSPIIQKLTKKKSQLKEEDIHILALFLSFMATRIPRQIELAREIGVAIAECVQSDLAKNPDEIQKILKALKFKKKVDNDVTVDEVEELLSQKYDITINKNAATGLSLISTFSVLNELINMNWCLFRSPSKSYFITSDCPLVSFVQENDGTAIIGAGFALQNVEVTFPISPEKCLYLDRKNRKRYRAVNKKVVKEINYRTSWAAERFLISHIKTRNVQKICDWSSSTLKQNKIDKTEITKEYKKLTTNNT